MIDFDKYALHYERMGNVVPDYKVALANPRAYSIEDEWLPTDKMARICDVGCGWGLLLVQLAASGYERLTGIEISRSQFEIARAVLPPSIELYCGDAISVLSSADEFDAFTIFDVIEHLHPEDAVHLLRTCYERLSPGGRVVIRVPNMSNVLASYSKYMDVTHVAGYTEWSLYQLLDAAGFSGHVVISTGRITWKKWRRVRTWRHPLRGLGLKEFLNSHLHRALFILRGQQPRPSTYATNIVVYSFRK